MSQYKHIEVELQKMREAKDAIERQLAELQERIDRTARAIEGTGSTGPDQPPA